MQGRSNNSASLDADWFNELFRLRCGLVGLFNQNQLIVNQQKGEFLKGVIPYPQLTYSRIRLEKFLNLRNEYVNFLGEVERDEVHHSLVRKYYLRKIVEKLKEIDMVCLVAQRYLGQISLEHFTQGFGKLTNDLFGSPKQQVFNEVLHEVGERMKVVGNKRPELGGHIEKFNAKYCMHAVPSNRPRVYFDRGHVNKNFTPLLTAEEVRDYFETALQRIGAQGDWRVVIDKKNTRKTIVVTGAGAKKVVIPNNHYFTSGHRRHALSAIEAQRLSVHEIDVHVKLRHSGERSPLKLLAFGLDQSRKAEEGLATFAEQELLGDNSYFAGYLSYFAIGLAHGLDRESTPRSFDEVYQVLYELFFIMERGKKMLAQSLAWDRCLRIFRGTFCNVPGLVFTKDIIYREGNIEIHKLLSETPTAREWVHLGLFDPTNREHVADLQTLGIVPHF